MANCLLDPPGVVDLMVDCDLQTFNPTGLIYLYTSLPYSNSSALNYSDALGERSCHVKGDFLNAPA